MTMRPERLSLSHTRLILLPALALLASLPGAAVVLAHAHYDHSQPAIGQVLSTAPARVDIYTDSDMRKLAGADVINVTAEDGSKVDDGNTVLDDVNRRHFSVGLNPNLPPGRYVVSFKTLSDADGDTDSGRFSFYVGAGPTAAQKAEDAALNGAPVTVAAPAQASPAGNGMRIALIAGAAITLLVLVAGASVVLRRRQIE